MSDESDIGNISRKNRKRPAHVAVTSDSSDSPLVTTSRSRKPPRIPSDQEEPSDSDSVVKKTSRKKKIPKLSSESENTDSDESNSSSDAIVARFPRKKKVTRLSSGSGDIDSSGNDSFLQNVSRKKKPSAISSGSNFDSDSDSFSKNVTRKKKAPVIESEAEISSLSSGSSIARLSRRRNVPRVTSDVEASYSEDESSFELRRPNKRAAARVITDDDDDDENDSAEEDTNDEILGQNVSDDNDDGMEETGSEESDSDSTDESDNDQAQAVTKTSTPTKSSPVKVAAGFDSSSDSDGQSDKCPICLLRFTTQEIGTPEACDHSFCAECLQEWSKNVNTCPVDRQPFTLILVRRHIEGKVIRQISVDTSRPESNNEEPPTDPTFCEICGACDREDRMLLCDVCDLGYHMECLDPPLETVPLEEWYCPDCNTNNVNMAEEVDFEENELLLLLEEAPEMGLPPLRPRPARRLVPRTRHSVRVQATMRTRPRQSDSNGAGTSRRRNAPDYNQVINIFFR